MSSKVVEPKRHPAVEAVRNMDITEFREQIASRRGVDSGVREASERSEAQAKAARAASRLRRLAD